MEVRLAGVLVEIQTEHLLKMSLGYYPRSTCYEHSLAV